MSIVSLILLATGMLVMFLTPVDKTTVVLMPDSDGKVGQVEVVTEGGRQLLDEAHQMTVVASAQQAPAATSIVSDEEVTRLFADALAVEPLEPFKYTLRFLPGSDELLPESLALLPEIASTITLRSSRDIGVHGHSDRVGAKEYNDALSLRRAQAVRALLIGLGVDEAIIETSSHGEGNPVVPTADDVAEPRNRRVEVVIR